MFTRLFTHSFLISVVVSSLTSQKALADDPPVNPAPTPTFSGFCSMEFLVSYITAAREIQVLASYLDAKEPIPNLFESNKACTKLMTTFPKMACIVPNSFEYAQTSDLAKECEIVGQLFAASDLANQPAPADNDSTPLNRLDLKKLRMTVQDKATLDSLIGHPRLAFAVNGVVYDISQAIEANDGTRCTIDADSAPKSFPSAGQTFSGQDVFEKFVSGIRVSSIVIDAEFNLVCMNDNGRPVTFGDLKKAFGSIVTFSMSQN
jgi:predicted heme/steroid binding protein